MVVCRAFWSVGILPPAAGWEPTVPVPPQSESPRTEGENAPRRPLRERVGWLVAAGAGVFLIGMLGSTGTLLYVGSASVQRVDVEVEGTEPREEPGGEADAERDTDIEEIDDVLQVLVVGSDRREDLSAADRDELGTGEADGERTDTIMLVRIDPATDDAHILSFPRDLLVSRCDGSRGKINAAYQIGEDTGVGGATCLVQTVRETSGLPIHHFVHVDFEGFVDLVDVVGGVSVYLEEPIEDWRANIDLGAGCQRLAGAEALGFVRHRQDSDYGRIARQQRVIKEIVDEAASLGTILNVPRMVQLVETAGRAVTTDSDLSLARMRRIGFSLRDLDGDSVVARTVPADMERINGLWFEVPREAEGEQLYRAFASGRLSPEAGSGAGTDAGHETAEAAPSGRDRPGAPENDSPDAGGNSGQAGGNSGPDAGDREGAPGADDSGQEVTDAPLPAEEEQYVGAQPPPERCR